jgi:murein L,D-transpeptidase YafK
MRKKLFIISPAFVLFAVAFFISNQFFAMPWEDSKLPKLKNPRVVVKKKDRILRVFDGEDLIKTYKIALGFTPVGDKNVEGDGKTPEGGFYVFKKNSNSKFYLSLGVSYPDIDAAKRALSENLISIEEHDAIVSAISEKQMPPQKTALGGEIYIHGGGILTDWTDGCIALRNEEMKELFDAVPVGVKVDILP